MPSMFRNALLLGCCTLAGFAGCGGGDEAPERSSSKDRALDGALAFARCMREHGVDVPDPRRDPDGMIKIAPGGGTGPGGGPPPNPEDPKFRKADEACGKHLEDGAGAPDREELEANRDAFVAYARCMRGEGIDMPDPGPDGGLRFRVGDPNAPNPESPAFKRANAVCDKHLADLAGPAAEASP
jgi:hypothetical protein